MLSQKRKLGVKSETSNPPPLKEQKLGSKHHEELAAFFGVKTKRLDSSRESDDLPEVVAEFKGITLEQKKRKGEQDLKQDEDKTKRTKGVEKEEWVDEHEAIQESSPEARQVEGYYSNDDVTILLDALLKRDGFERIRGGDEQDILTSLQTGQNLGTMVLAPIVEDSDAAIEQLGRDIDRAYRNDIEQILVPINIRNIHWYTIQLLILRGPGGYCLEAIIHDSLGIRKDSIIVEQLVRHGLEVTRQQEGSLPQIQTGEFGAKNVYCGGYTARLIANLAADSRSFGEAAWGCPNNFDHILRQEDARLVSEYNFPNAGNFGRGFLGLKEMMGAAQDMSLLRSFIAKEKEFKLLQELKSIYETVPIETKLYIKSLIIPEDPVALSALVRDLYTGLPSVLKGLFKVNALGEIEKDAEGLLKLDTNLEIEQIHNILVEFQRECLKFDINNIMVELQRKSLELERLGIEYPEDDGAEPENQELSSNNYRTANPEDDELGSLNKALDSSELILNMIRALDLGSQSDVAISFKNIGNSYCKLGKFKKSIYYYEQALKVSQSLHQGNHLDVAESLNNLGSAYEASGDVNTGLSYWEQALKMMQALYPDGHLEISVLLNNIGSAYETLGDARNGIAYMEQALEAIQDLLTGNHPEIATMLSNVGTAYGSLGEEMKGLGYLERALKMRQSLYPDGHPDVAESLDDVGSAYRSLGATEKGLSYLEQALKMRQILYPDGHLDVADSLNAVGGVYESLGHVRQGLLYMEQALKMMQNLYPGDNQEVLESLDAVGSTYKELGDLEKSLYYLEQALKMTQALHKGNNPEVAILLNKVGILHKALGDVNTALDYLEQALEMRQALYGGNHPDVATSLNNVGLTYGSLGDIRTGLDYLEQALAMRQALYPTGHFTVVKSLKNVGLAYKKLGDDRKYNDYMKLAKRMREALKKPNQEVAQEFKGQGTLSYTTNSRLEYYNTAVDQILELRLGGLSNSKAVVLKSRYFGKEISLVAERLAYDVRIILSDDNTKTILAPINLYNQHWLGLAFRNLAGVVEVTYLDSEQKAIAPQLRAGLEQSFAMNSFITSRLERQSYNNCGPELIENFLYYLTGTRATQEAAVYIHSLLVENSLLAPEEYGLKIAENNRLIGFLSNAAPLKKRSPYHPRHSSFRSLVSGKHDSTHITLVGRDDSPPASSSRMRGSRMTNSPKGAITLLRCSGSTGAVVLFEEFSSSWIPAFARKSKEWGAFRTVVSESWNEAGVGEGLLPIACDVCEVDVIGHAPYGAIDLNLLPAIEQFNRLSAKWVQNKLQQVNAGIYKTTLGFKGLDLTVDSARLVYEPGLDNAKKVALDAAQLYGMYSGVNGYSALVTGAEVVYQLHLGEYQKACDAAAGTVSSMALPVILAYANRPYLGFVYSVFVAANTVYKAVDNAYSFALELLDGSGALGSKSIVGLDSENNNATVVALEL